MRARPAPLLVVAAAAAAVIAGCASAPSPVVDVQRAAPPPALRFGDAVPMDQPSGGGEPNVAILPDGTVFVTAVAGAQDRPNHERGAAWLWRSRDVGATWETLREPERSTPLGTAPFTRKTFASSDADVVASPDGWVYYSDWWSWGSPLAVRPPVNGLPVTTTTRAGNFLVERSADGGGSWASATFTVPDRFGVDRQWLLAGPDGLVGLFYAHFPWSGTCTANVGLACEPFRTSIKAAWSRDHGATWSEPAAVIGGEDDVAYQIAHPAILPDGTILMPFARIPLREGYWRDPGEVRVARSGDGGATWSDTLVAAALFGFDNLWAVQGAADGAGGYHVAFAARQDDARMSVSLSTSTDGGATWHPPRVLREDGLNFLPWVAARGAGEVAVGWYGGDATGDPVKAPEDATWHAYVWHSGANATTIASEEPVKTGPICPRGASCTSDRELLDYVGLAFAPDGALHYAFTTSREADGATSGLVRHARADPWIARHA